MKQHDFEQLGQEAQIDLLYRWGVYIGKQWKGPLPVVLYQIEGFYVEVTYLKYRLQVDSISCFSSTAQLDPYLAQMDLELFV